MKHSPFADDIGVLPSLSSQSSCIPYTLWSLFANASADLIMRSVSRLLRSPSRKIIWFGYTFFLIFFLLNTAVAEARLYYDKPRNVKPLTADISLPMNRISSKHYCVDVYINHRGPFKFLVDTGASLSVISQELANKLNLETVKRVKFSRNNSQFRGNLYRIPSLRLGSAEIYDYDMMVYPEPTFISYLKEGFHEHIDGILGIGAFYEYLLTLDFQHSVLRLENRHLTSNANTSTFDNSEKIPIVVVVFKDDKNHVKEMNFVVDSGSNEEFTLPPGIVALPFTKMRSQSIQNGSHYGEQTAAKEKIAANAYWGRKEFKEPNVVYNKTLYDTNVSFGLMGILVMEHLKITIDQRKRLIQIE
ncbi:MAG: hypothetical protein BGO43_02170 [Gammaproteobacteria bacterium 39-13]|mgnify:CR=1 FL=1|nr:clan AA aspartic protease [Gammaproteobacteria bacterium]OJV87358.1 MAG: hypothetical protein BGO43_02170 [Gammaproteobacteria bacterium 39-13]